MPREASLLIHLQAPYFASLHGMTGMSAGQSDMVIHIPPIG